ncbi:Uncharacterized protein APZ42_001286, partial [Daphnia magna]
SKGCISSDDQRALTIAKEKTRRLAVGYEVPIIWREGEPDLINNQQMAKNRFQSLLRRFQTQPELERDYEAAMQKNLDQGYASRIQDPVDVNTSWPITECTRARNYASCLTPPQPSREAIAWASDIEAMFSRFRLAAEDTKYFCFLWRDKKSAETMICKMERLPFGASCSPFVAIHAIQRIAEDAGIEGKIATAVRERFYVDDYLSSAATVAEAVQEASAVKNMLANADLNLQRWISNSSEFMRSLSNNVKPHSN